MMQNLLRETEKKLVIEIEMYNKGLDDAWDVLRRIFLATNEHSEAFTGQQIAEIFNMEEIDVLKKLTPQQVIVKIRDYEKRQAQIKVGDVLKHRRNSSNILVVTHVFDDNTFSGMNANGETYSNRNTSDWVKTGKHVDFNNVFQQIKI